MRTFIFIVLFVAFTDAIAGDDQFSSQEELGRWLTYYYLEPEPDRIPTALRYMSESGALDEGNTLPSIFGFLSGCFASNPDAVKKTTSALENLPDNHFSVVLLGLWYANLPNSQSEVYQFLDSNRNLNNQLSYLRTGMPMALFEIPLEQGPWVLDALWGRYFATGKSETVERIAEALPWSEVKEDIGRLLVGGAAKWSLSSNAFQHERVKEIVVSLSERNPENKYLAEVLTQAAQYETEKANQAN
ncbi:MAG: hypothetical protein N0E58_21455 [Candidatus Thiodiazotropha endolucinida]|uniref:Uncharacterized protein n=1 Tax=Candidatus Thiodiazotropha taylori TaxID=2792791 RepID=A0A9E4TUS3_9GAMM|nr:hypothetical protein [Candidatus Thiodiazotropha taylori]MCW4238820.1 hypothetical protein [Candidatus Thiodiazotropha endolucinida]